MDHLPNTPLQTGPGPRRLAADHNAWLRRPKADEVYQFLVKQGKLNTNGQKADTQCESV